MKKLPIAIALLAAGFGMAACDHNSSPDVTPTTTYISPSPSIVVVPSASKSVSASPSASKSVVVVPSASKSVSVSPSPEDTSTGGQAG